MKYLILLFGMVLSILSFSQDTLRAPILNHEIQVNTIGVPSISVAIAIDFSQGTLAGYSIDDETFDALNAELVSELVSKKSASLIHHDETFSLAVSPHKIVFTVFNVSDELISLLSDSIADIYIQTNKDIVFLAWDGSDAYTLTPVKLDRGQIEKNTRSTDMLTESMAQELINAKGGTLFMTQNTFDFGVIPAQQSSSNKTGYNISFNYLTRYSFIKNAPLFFSAEGLIGTNSKDSLNYISLYPVNFNFLKGSNHLIGQLGLEGDQVFSNYRISANFSWNGMIPNLIDFTFGEDRLRLKPVIKAGFKFYQEIENNRPVAFDENKFSNQVYGDIYYYIPIKKIYSLILEGTAFYDFNPNANPGEVAMFNYSASFGIDIPGTDFKTLFKYAKGENGISYKADNYLMIGLAVDLFRLD